MWVNIVEFKIYSSLNLKLILKIQCQYSLKPVIVVAYLKSDSIFNLSRFCFVFKKKKRFFLETKQKNKIFNSPIFNINQVKLQISFIFFYECSV